MHNDLLTLIQGVVAGQHTLAMLPTPGSKVACCLLAAWQLPGCTVVLSSQPSWWCRECQRISDIVVWTPSEPHAGPSARRDQLAMHKSKVVCLTPEQVQTGSPTLSALRRCPVNLLVIDEAEELTDAEALPALIERLGHPTVLVMAQAMAATAARQLGHRLGLTPLAQHTIGAYRAHLSHRVDLVRDEQEKIDRLHHHLDQTQGAAVVIVRDAPRAVLIHGLLCRRGEEAALLHQAQSPHDSRQAQEAFNMGQRRVLVTTTPVPTLLDRPDVRLMIHLDLPGGLDVYQRETALAGQDGERAQAVLLCSREDPQITLESLLPHPDATDSPRALARWVCAHTPQAAQCSEALERLIYFAHCSECRWKVVLDYLGEDVAFTRCGDCDNCTQQAARPDADAAADHGLEAGQPVSVLRHGWGWVRHVSGDVVSVDFLDGRQGRFVAHYVRPLSPRALRFARRLLPTRVRALLDARDHPLESAMTNSQLWGLDEGPDTDRPGHGVSALGPSDSSDSASDLSGIEVDGSTDDLNQDTDAQGTGEHLGARTGPPVREGYDILPDRIVDDPDEELVQDDDQAVLADDGDDDERRAAREDDARELPQALQDIMAQPDR